MFGNIGVILTEKENWTFESFGSIYLSPKCSFVHDELKMLILEANST